MARVLGALATELPTDNGRVDGLLLLKDYSYSLVSPADLSSLTPLVSSTLVQRPSFHYTGGVRALVDALRAVFEVDVDGGADGGGVGGHGRGSDPAEGEVIVKDEGGDGGLGGAEEAAADAVVVKKEPGLDIDEAVEEETGRHPASDGDKAVRLVVRGGVSIGVDARASRVTLEWHADPMSDVVADAVCATLVQLLGDACKSEHVHAPDETRHVDSADARAVASVLGVLRETFGHVDEVEAEGQDDTEHAPRWELSACGARVRVTRGAHAPGAAGGGFDVESDDADARARVERVVQRARRAALPISRS